MKSHLKYRTYVILTVIFAVWSAILAGCNILCGDDITWTYDDAKSDLYGDKSINGRYFTNFLTYYAVRSFVLRFLIAFVFVFLLHQLLLRVLETKASDSTYTAVFSAVSIMTLHSMIFTQSLNWISGITNYVISIVLLFLWFLYCKPVFYGTKPERKMWQGFLMFPVGFLGALCVENVTIYMLLLAVFVIFYSYRQFKKIDPGHILYLTGAAAGAVLMFSNHTYSSLFGGGSDDIGFRSVNYDINDMFHQIYEDVMEYYCVPFWILHIVICISFAILFSVKYSASPDKLSKYTKPCLCVTVLYTAYSFFTNSFVGFSVWNAGLTIRALETAFTFFYLISLVYLAWALCTRQGFIRFTLYILSTVILSAPFAVADPVTPRCFFTDYIFWVLAAGEISVQARIPEKFCGSYPLRLVSVLSAGYVAFSISYMCLWNKYTDNLRFRYLREQVDSGKQSVELIRLPYPDYVPRDELEALKISIDERAKQDTSGQDKEAFDTTFVLGKEVLRSHGVDTEIINKPLIIISLYDYDLK